ncbi:MAG: hypothetical protein U0230_12335 [Polyangiales bacterium]
MSITVHSPTWTTDPSVLASLLALVGAGATWFVGRLAALVGRWVHR